MAHFEKGYLAGAEPREKRIAELEAENEANENGAKKYADYYFKTNNQLTKAKELLEEVCNSIPSSVAEYIKEPLEKAKQFLQECK